MNRKAHTGIWVNDVEVLYSYNWDNDVDRVIVNPTAVLHLNQGDRVRVSDGGPWTGDIRGSTSIMYTWFSVTLLYADN